MGSREPLGAGLVDPGLAEAYQLFATLSPASMIVIDRGRIVVAWEILDTGETEFDSKSLLNALYGTPVHDGRINLDFPRHRRHGAGEGLHDFPSRRGGRCEGRKHLARAQSSSATKAGITPGLYAVRLGGGTRSAVTFRA